jgi:hypothetical protein
LLISTRPNLTSFPEVLLGDISKEDKRGHYHGGTTEKNAQRR